MPFNFFVKYLIFSRRARAYRRVDRKEMIDRTHELPMSRQCCLLDIGRSSYFYQAVPVDQRDVDLMRAIDETQLKYPFYGSTKKYILRRTAQSQKPGGS